MIMAKDTSVVLTGMDFKQTNINLYAGAINKLYV